ncbi:MAG: hypothetical protein K2N03_00755 [Muribaculaceae bacterium]|nr:hypothetical protein [Muribaculaceae bacterium]
MGGLTARRSSPSGSGMEDCQHLMDNTPLLLGAVCNAPGTKTLILAVYLHFIQCSYSLLMSYRYQ